MVSRKPETRSYSNAVRRMTMNMKSILLSATIAAVASACGAEMGAEVGADDWTEEVQTLEEGLNSSTACGTAPVTLTKSGGLSTSGDTASAPYGTAGCPDAFFTRINSYNNTGF